jgi:6-phosphogluconolactonase (cycloisomerase 2 family)
LSSSFHTASSKFPHLLTALVAGALLASCGGDSVTQTATYSVGGLASGLVGTGLVLQDNSGNNLTVSGNGPFTFSTALTNGSSYLVSVATQPTKPTQNCIVVPGSESGTVAGANVTSVQVQCSTEGFTVGGAVSGLAGSGLVLQDNAGNDLSISASGPFTFLQTVGSGSGYAVTVKTQPISPAQNCAVTNGSGTVGSANVANVQVTCTTNGFSISGNITGLTGTGLVLQTNGTTIPISGTSFSISLPNGTAYNVMVTTQPTNPSQNCVVANGSGTAIANVGNVTVTCATQNYTLSGVVSNLVGTGFVLRNNGTPVALSGNAYSISLTSGTAYNLSVTNPTGPSQTCVASNGSGTITNANVTANVACTTNKYTVSVTVSGLRVGATGLSLLNNGGDSLSITGNTPPLFTFATSITSGQAYAVTVGTQPTATPAQYCIVQNGSGTVTSANVTSVTLTCRNVGQALFVAISLDGAGNTGSVGGYTINPSTGVLRAAIGSPFTAANTDLNPNSVTLDVSGQYAYVANLNSSNVSTFSVSTSAGVPTGALAFTADTATSAAPPYKTFTVAVSPNGSYAFVGSDENPNGIADAYTLSGGVLTSVGPPTTAGNDPMVMVVDPTSSFLFAPEPFDSDIAVFAIGGGGVLGPAAYFPSGAAALGPTGVTLLPPRNGQPGYIFVANTGHATQAVGATVLVFSYDGTSGALATVGSPYAVGSAGFSLPMAVTIDPTARFLYVTDYQDNTVSEFSINATNGQLQAVGTPVATGTAPVDIKIEPSGHFAYVANFFGNTIDVYSIDPTTGALTLVPSGGTVPTGTGPTSIAIE